jgi:hypothetical protein
MRDRRTVAILLILAERFTSDDGQVTVRRLADRHHETFGQYLGRCTVCLQQHLADDRALPDETAYTPEEIQAKPSRLLRDLDAALDFLARHEHRGASGGADRA